jgi:hypothetical protein
MGHGGNMTFKNTSGSLNHIARVASASTRPRATGRIDLIPPDAKEPEEYYNTIRDQYFEMNARFQHNQARLTELKAQLRQNLPKYGYERANAEYVNLKPQQAKLQDELAHLRIAVHAAGANAYGIVFKEVAKRVLDSETIVKIAREVEALLGRPEHEITRRSDGGSKTRSDKLKDRRRKVRFGAERRQAWQERQG